VIVQKNLSHEIACLDDLRARDSIVDVHSFPAGLKDSRISHEREVLRDIRLRDLHSFNDISGGHLVMSEDAEDLQPFWMGESLADVGVQSKDLVVQGRRVL